MSGDRHVTMFQPARVLSVCRAGGALFTRTEVLRSGGYHVVTASSIYEALAAIGREPFDVVIVGQRYDNAEKTLIATAARQGGSKVLCMHSENHHPDIPAANAFIHNLDGPERLLSAVASLLAEKASA